jgi:hypothetical protein
MKECDKAEKAVGGAEKNVNLPVEDMTAPGTEL